MHRIPPCVPLTHFSIHFWKEDHALALPHKASASNTPVPPPPLQLNGKPTALVLYNFFIWALTWAEIHLSLTKSTFAFNSPHLFKPSTGFVPGNRAQQNPMNSIVALLPTAAPLHQPVPHWWNRTNSVAWKVEVCLHSTVMQLWCICSFVGLVRSVYSVSFLFVLVFF